MAIVAQPTVMESQMSAIAPSTLQDMGGDLPYLEQGLALAEQTLQNMARHDAADPSDPDSETDLPTGPDAAQEAEDNDTEFGSLDNKPTPSGSSNVQTNNSSTASLGESSDSIEDMSRAMIVYFPQVEGRCYPHTFDRSTKTENYLGHGAFGQVYKVECTLCHKEFAKKIIRVPSALRRVAREKHLRDTDMELRCYMTLKHPNVIEYVHHELSGTKMEIFTEYCELRDLESCLNDGLLDEIIQNVEPDVLAWSFIEALASALARCHHGLEAIQVCGTLSYYSEFTAGWHPILHRDIKPGNVLLAFRNSPHELVPKLGDFGTSFQLEDGATRPESYVGTRVYWAPEIAEESDRLEGRITKWSMKSDVWGAGAVAHRILTMKIPSIEQPTSLDERIAKLRSLAVGESREPMSAVLAQVVAECLHPDPESRLSTLNLLAVAIKSDTDERGLRRSETFWLALSRHTDTKLVASTITYFVTKHLTLLGSAQTLFSPREVVIIMSLARLHCPNYMLVCHTQLCTALTGNLAGSTVFHTLARLGSDDEDVLKLAFEDSKWPQSKELAHVATRKNNLGLLPSSFAALCGNIPLSARLTQIEDDSRAETAKIASTVALSALQRKLETAAKNEFEFLFKLLTAGSTEQFVIKHSQMPRAMIETAQLGYGNVVRKLVDIGIPITVRGKHQETVLHVFSHAGDVSMVRFLLDNGAPVDARDRDERTPLHWAAWAGQHDTTRELLSRGADVNAVDKLSRSALFGAAGGGYLEVVRLLLQRRANKQIRGGRSSQTPLDRAKAKNRREVVALLED